MNEYQDRCPTEWKEHFWSFPDADGMSECLWCRARKKFRLKKEDKAIIETIERPNDPTLRVCQPQWEGSDLSFLDNE